MARVLAAHDLSTPVRTRNRGGGGGGGEGAGVRVKSGAGGWGQQIVSVFSMYVYESYSSKELIGLKPPSVSCKAG